MLNWQGPRARQDVRTVRVQTRLRTGVLCHCGSLRLEGPDVIQLGYERTAQYQVRGGPVCDGEVGYFFWPFPRQGEEFTWSVSPPATIEPMGPSAVVHVPPPSQAHERIEVTLTVRACYVTTCQTGTTYNSCYLTCSLSKTITYIRLSRSARRDCAVGGRSSDETS